MRYKKSSIPKPSKGVDFSKEVDIVVPDESMSLEEILKRFTRGEAVAAGHETEFDNDSEIDMEKLRNADLVDKAEMADQMKEVQKRFDEQEKARKDALNLEKSEASKKAEEKRIRIAARKLAKRNSEKQHSSPLFILC